jgi:hypothetical protein
MIAPLRNTHRRTLALLSLIVPAVLTIGVAARHPGPAPEEPATSVAELHSAAGHFSVLTLDDRRISVRTRTPVPDPLLYWSSAAPAADVLETATFLGSADPHAAYDLPPEAGHLVLYSGGHRRVVDFLRLEARP